MKDTTFEKFTLNLQTKTERYLTWRKRKKKIKSDKHKQRNVIIDWLDAFLWAAMVVLLINQYLFQAYQIPTPSMERTILVSDRIFVNKFIYGPELIPGMFKINGLSDPGRTEIVIFENPSYLSRGAGFDILQRVLYMITLTLVDIDKDENGNPKAHFLIKRAVGEEGDRLIFHQGDLFIQPRGEDEWIAESDFKLLSGYDYQTQRLASPSGYDVLYLAAEASAMSNHNLPVSDDLVSGSQRFQNQYYKDAYEYTRHYSETSYWISPQQRGYSSRFFTYRQGQYLPDGWLLPLGDNRDNSNDGRYFGPIRKSDILGRASFTYWPLSRIGTL